LVLTIFAFVVFILPGPVILAILFAFVRRGENPIDSLVYMMPMLFLAAMFPLSLSFWVVAVFLFWLVFCLPAGIMLITAPRFLAPVALGLIERLDLNYLIFVPILDDDFTRSRFMEAVAGAPVSDERINRSLFDRIWWMSSQMRPDYLLGGIPGYLASRWPELPKSLTNAGLPVSRLGSLVLRQWYLYLSQAIAWFSCCNSCCCAYVLIPALMYRLAITVHSLAYSAAYCKLLVDDWPWRI